MDAALEKTGRRHWLNRGGMQLKKIDDAKLESAGGPEIGAEEGRELKLVKIDWSNDAMLLGRSDKKGTKF